MDDLRRGVTRIEVLVVSILVLIVGGLILAFLLRSRGLAAQVSCAENLRRLGVAVYERVDIKIKAPEANEGSLRGKSTPLPAARIAEGYGTWAVQLAPYLADKSPLARWDLSLPFTRQSEEIRNAALPPFFCLARTRPGLIFTHEEGGKTMSGAFGDYACASGDGKIDWTGPDANGGIIQGEVVQQEGVRILKWRSRTSLSALEAGQDRPGRGLSYTILIGEKHVPLAELGRVEAGDGSLYDGRHPACYARVGGPGYALASHPDAPFNDNFGSYHPESCHFLFADLKVQPTKTDISPEVLAGLIRRGK